MQKFLLLTIIFSITSSIEAQTAFSPPHIISTEAHYSMCVYSDDLDGDGDKDVLSVSKHTNEVAWYENNGTGYFGSKKIIHNEFYYPHIVLAADLDGDGDKDVIYATGDSSYDTPKSITLAKNDGKGNFSSPIIIQKDNDKDITSLNVGDLNRDKKIDIIATLRHGIDLVWFPNSGNYNTNVQNMIKIRHLINYTLDSHISDLDKDGDLDIITSTLISDKIEWIENSGYGEFEEFDPTVHNVSVYTSNANAVKTSDIDNDGDIDIIASSFSEDKIILFENEGLEDFGTGANGQDIVTEVGGPSDLLLVDLDKDGDDDIIAAYYNDNKIAWYENDGHGNFSPENVLSTTAMAVNSLFAVDLDGDDDLDIVSSTFGNNKIEWYENLLDQDYLYASAFQDTNENGVYDENEKPLFNLELVLEPSPEVTFTKYDGNTYFFTKYGDYQLAYKSHPLWELTTNSEFYDVEFKENMELPIYRFGFKPTRILPRIEAYLTNSPTRCNTKATYWLHYSNTGTTIADGIVTLEVEDNMTFVKSEPMPDVIEGKTLSWHFEELHPTHKNKIELQLKMPGVEAIGDVLYTEMSVYLFNESQETVRTQIDGYFSRLLCSYDPNDKLARSNLLGQSEFAYLADTILYTVRFQNTGNDTAFNIRIEDVLDKKLDWTTFHPITASHDYRTELNRETGLATFYFDNIMLPDSTTDKEGSNGFVMFGIASLPDLQDKVEVDNTASIFFDFNPPIITNTATLTLIEQVETNIEVLENGALIRVFPNPFLDYTTIEVSGLSAKGDYRVEVMDILGRKVRELDLKDGKVRLERGDLESGLYLIQILEKENGRILGSKKILIE